MRFSSELLKIWFFQRVPRLHKIFLVLSGKMVFFFPKTKAKDDLSQEIHGNMMHRPAKKKTGNLILRVEVWPFLKFIWLEIFHNE